MSELAAYVQGVSDAVDYDAYNPASKPCLNDAETQGYRDGYRDGMDLNLTKEKGVCPDAKEQFLLLSGYKCDSTLD